MDNEVAQETVPYAEKKDQVSAPQAKPKSKRDIVYFASEKPTAINFDHVAIMRQEGKTLFFDFHNKTLPVELADEDSAKSAYQSLLNLWSGEANSVLA